MTFRALPLILALAHFAHAEPTRPPASSSTSIPNPFDAPAPPPPTHRSILLDLDTLSPDPLSTTDFLALTAPTHLPPASLRVEYHGLQDFVTSKLRGRLRSLWRGHLEDLWAAGTISDTQLRSRFQRMYDALADHEAGGRYWERSWLDSLPPHKGGAPKTPTTHHVGKELPLIQLGPFSLSNRLRARIDSVAAFDLDSDPDVISRPNDPQREHARDLARLGRVILDPEDRSELATPGAPPPAERLLATQVDINVLPTPEPHFVSGYRVRFKVRPRLRVQPDLTTDWRALVRNLSCTLTCELRDAFSDQHFLDLEFDVRYDPPDNELVLSAQLAFLTW